MFCETVELLKSVNPFYQSRCHIPIFTKLIDVQVDRHQTLKVLQYVMEKTVQCFNKLYLGLCGCDSSLCGISSKLTVFNFN